MIDQQQSDALIQMVTTAFRNVRYPGVNRVLHEGCTDVDHEVNALLKAVRGDDWREIPSKVLEEECSALAFLSPDGFTFFLPAYLVHVIRNHRESNATQSTISSLYPEGGSQRKYFLSRISALNPDQRMAIRSFLEWLAKAEPSDSETWQASDALRRFWYQMH